jgi:glutathione S-transferase
MPGPLRLITIGFSHFCEKARWALDRSALEYREDDHAPLLHWRASFGARGGRTVPIVVTPSAVLRESTQIVRFVDEHLPAERRLIPEDPAQRTEVMALMEAFDRGLGPAVRRSVYYNVLAHRQVAAELLSSTGPAWERRWVRRLFPVMRTAIVRGLKVEPAAVERSRQRIEQIFADVEARLADGRRYLVGDRFSAADLTLAALGGLLVRPPEFGWKIPTAAFEIPENVAVCEAVRARPVGQHMLRMYAEERPPVRASQG